MIEKKRGPKGFSTPQVSGYVPPQDESVEVALLGTIMSEPAALVDMLDNVGPEIFFQEKHRAMYRAVIDLSGTSSPIQPDTLADAFVKAMLYPDKKAALVDIIAYVRRTRGSHFIPGMLQTLRELAKRRDLIVIGSQASSMAHDYSVTSEEIYANIMSQIDALFDNQTADHGIARVGVIRPDVIANLRATKSGGGLIGIHTGVSKLNDMVFGWRKKHLLIVGGRPGMGKTALAISAMYAMASRGEPCLMFSLEMPKEEVVMRLQSIHHRIDGADIQQAKVSPQIIDIMESDKVFAGLPIYIDDTPSQSIHVMRSKARRMVRSHGIKAVFVDYLQLITGTDPDSSNDTRASQIGYISRSLKSMAKALDIPVIALVQLSRKVEERPKKVPMLSDLRESGEIEQDADAVIFCYRPEYYGIMETDNGISTINLGSLIVAKHRHGATGSAPVSYVKEFALWCDHGSVMAPGEAAQRFESEPTFRHQSSSFEPGVTDQYAAFDTDDDDQKPF